MTFSSGGGYTNIQKYSLTYGANGSFIAYTCPVNTVTRIKLQYWKVTSPPAAAAILRIDPQYGGGTATPIQITTVQSTNYITIPAQEITSQVTNSLSAVGQFIPSAVSPSQLFITGHYDPYAQEIILTAGEKLVLVISSIVSSPTLEFVAQETTT